MEKINIAELLKDCPKGMELDCTMFDGVYFDHVDDLRHNSIKCYVNNGNEHFGIALDEHGQYISNKSAKCVIFPKGKTTWEGFVPPCKFKDGDIIYIYSANPWICIYKEGGEKANVYYKYVAITTSSFVHDCFPLCHRNTVEEIRHATEEEKAKLFQAIKDNGYRWNSETKTLEKLVEPKFKVGDKIKHKDTVLTIITVQTNNYIVEDEIDNFGILIFSQQDKWELVPNKFDITTLKPFDSRVLVRGDKSSYWKPAIFGCYIKDMIMPYYALGGTCWHQCIPYEGNQHLLGTTNDCDEFYKTWK